jgi:hypothetical protein
MPAIAAIDNETLDHVMRTWTEARERLQVHFKLLSLVKLFARVRGFSSVLSDFVPPVCPQPLRASLNLKLRGPLCRDRSRTLSCDQ